MKAFLWLLLRMVGAGVLLGIAYRQTDSWAMTLVVALLYVSHELTALKQEYIYLIEQTRLKLALKAFEKDVKGADDARS